MDDQLLKLGLSSAGSNAMWNVIQSTSINGRVAARLSRGCALALKKLSMQEVTEGEHKGKWEHKGGDVALTVGQLEWLNLALEQRLKQGVPGGLGEGMGDLIEQIEQHLPPTKE
jgi:hypothetical protein